MLRRNPLAKLKSKDTGDNSDGEEQPMLVDEDDNQLFLDPAPFARLRSKQEDERYRDSSTYSSADLCDEFQPLLVNNSVVEYTTSPPAYLLRNTAGLRMGPSYVSLGTAKVQSSEAVKTNPSGKIVLPELVLKDDGLKVVKRDHISVSLEANSENDFLLEYNKIREIKASGSRRKGNDRRDLITGRKTNTEVRPDTFKTRGPNSYSEGDPNRCVVSTPKRAINRITTTKNQLQFSDIFSEDGQFSESETFTLNGAPNSLEKSAKICKEIVAKSKGNSDLGMLSDSGHQVAKSDIETQVYKQLLEEQDNGEDPCGVTVDGRQLTSDLLKKRGEHFGDAQSERSFVLAVDHLTDIRERNKFVRQYAGTRRMAVCEELEKVIICNGACLFKLRTELNIEQVLNNMFMT